MQLIELKSLIDEHSEQSKGQANDLESIRNKFQQMSAINTQLNDELNAKTEEICSLHSVCTELNVAITDFKSKINKLEMENDRLAAALRAERDTSEKCDDCMKKTHENERLQNRNIQQANEVSCC